MNEKEDSNSENEKDKQNNINNESQEKDNNNQIIKNNKLKEISKIKENEDYQKENDENSIEEIKKINEKEGKINFNKNDLLEDINTSNINDINEQDLSTMKLKIQKLKQNYDFSIQYQDTIFNFINYINDLIYEKVNNSIYDNLNFIYFFETLSQLYSDFSQTLKNSNYIIQEENLSKMNNDIYKNSIENVKNLIETDFSKKSESIKKNIENYNKIVKEKVKEIMEMKEKNYEKYKDTNEIKNKLEENYLKTYYKLFNSEIKSTNLPDFPDLVIATKDLIEVINDLILGVDMFIKITKDSLLTLNNIFYDINELIKNSIVSYISQNKNSFSNELISKFEEIEKKVKTLGENPEDKMFTFSQIINSASQRNKINNLLEHYSILLGLSENTKLNNNPYLIEKYKDIDSFFNFLISKSPKTINLTIDDLIIKKLEIQYYPGFLKSWKDCFIFFTIQKHLIIFDKEDTYSIENVIKIFQMNKINFKLNSNFERPFIFEISPNYDVIIFKRYHTYSFDALNNRNLFELCVIFKEYINNKN